MLEDLFLDKYSFRAIINFAFESAYPMRECWNRQTGRLEVPVSNHRRVGSSPISRTTKDISFWIDVFFCFLSNYNNAVYTVKLLYPEEKKEKLQTEGFNSSVCSFPIILLWGGAC